MKPVRRKIGRRNRRMNLVSLIVICVVLPVTAIYIGLRITENWVSPVLNPEESQFDFLFESNEPELEEEEVAEEVTPEPAEEEEDPIEEAEDLVDSDLQVNAMGVYAIQIASLDDTTNLDMLIQQLNEQKLAYLVYRTDTGYKVFANGATDRNLIEAQLTQVKEYYPDAFIQMLTTDSIAIPYGETQKSELEKVVAHLNELIVLVENQGKAWYQAYVTEGVMDEYQTLLTEQLDLLGELNTLIESTPENLQAIKVDKIVEMIEYQNTNIDRSLEMIEANQPEEFYQIHSLYLDSLFRIVELTNELP